jgi:hypothetical protein
MESCGPTLAFGSRMRPSGVARYQPRAVLGIVDTRARHVSQRLEGMRRGASDAAGDADHQAYASLGSLERRLPGHGEPPPAQAEARSRPSIR